MSTKSCFHARLTTIALCLAAASLTAACGGGGGGAGASEVDAARGGGTSGSPSGSTPTTSAVPSDALFACDFSSGWQQCGFGEQSKGGEPRATLVTVDGRPAVRLHTKVGDNNVAGSGDNERNDLKANTDYGYGYEGEVQWWAHSVRFPDDYVDPPKSETSWNFGIVANFHNTTNGGGQANFQIMAMPRTATSSDRPTGLNFQVNSGTQLSPTQHSVHIGPVVRNVWYNFVYHVKWTSKDDGSGFFNAWVNGVQMMAYRGPTLYAGQGVYLKLANYHSPHGNPSSVIHARVIRSNTPLDVAAGL